MASSVFDRNGIRNPPKGSGPTNHSSSHLYRSGFRLLPSETVDVPKTVSVRDGKTGRNILNPRININDEAFQYTLTHLIPEHVHSDKTHPMRSKQRRRPIRAKRIKTSRKRTKK